MRELRAQQRSGLASVRDGLLRWGRWQAYTDPIGASSVSNYRYELRPDLSPEQVADLRTAVGWDAALPLYRRTLGHTFAWAGAFVGDQLIAYGDVVSDGIADAYIRDLVVHPDHQRQGVGSHLLALLIEAVRGAGVRMVSTVFEPGLATFYRKAGFHVVSGGLIDLDPPANALE